MISDQTYFVSDAHILAHIFAIIGGDRSRRKMDLKVRPILADVDKFGTHKC